MQKARSKTPLVEHDIELFSLLAPEVREAYKPLECLVCEGKAWYTKESVDGRGAHFAASHLDEDCRARSGQGPSETEGHVSWREGGRPAVLDPDAPAVLFDEGKEGARKPRARRELAAEKRRASGPSSRAVGKGPTLATLLKFVEQGALRTYPSFVVRLSENDEIDVAQALCSLDELGLRPVGDRVVAFGRIAMAREVEGNLWLHWRKDQPTKIMVPAELVDSRIGEGWEWIRVERYRPKLILVTTINRSRAGKDYLRAEKGLFLIDMRPWTGMSRRGPGV